MDKSQMSHRSRQSGPSAVKKSETDKKKVISLNKKSKTLSLANCLWNPSDVSNSVILQWEESCIAEVSTQGDTPLVVATSHLESPCPGPPKWDQMYSKERVKQANEAVDFLKKNPNAIFCGDMNWDDKLDGEFPLPDGWIDAWTELKPKEIGWTYDTKANLMLSANRKLRKRLDRFLIRLCDFKVESINMVGTARIPEVTYMKAKKGKTDLELPVLPSDQFGLLFTMSA